MRKSLCKRNTKRASFMSRIKKLGITFVALLLVFCHTNVNAQERIHFRNYTVTDGLQSNTVWAISQDEQGYMWFGTKDGLSRFDGYQFKSFKFDKNYPS